jgi:hypothetical protein
MEQLLDKLVKSKAIMDATSNIKRGEVRRSLPEMNSVQDFDIPQAKYNIPQEFLSEGTPSQNYLSSVPKENTKPVGVPSVEAIKKSKLPDEIKRLMMEHPISQPQQPQMTISDDLIEKASRLMNKTNNNYVPESAKTKQPTTKSESIDYNLIKKMINEAVEEALQQSGLVVESTEKTNETFSFRVGKHIFEGKISKVKKLS